jgi:hypothetical protein
MTIGPTARCALIILLLASLSSAGAQSGVATRRTTRCDRIATTTFEFGRTGGNIRPASIHIAADGAVTTGTATAAPATPLRTIPQAVVTGLARLAWTGGFATLRPAPTRPTRNPDAAREFIEARSACGAHRSEYAMGEEAPPFRELYALLEMAAGPGAPSP